MAINAYTGLMGSGKTYEVVSSVILPAIKAGRDVVTNIYGLNQDLVYKHLEQPDKGCEFGKIRIVQNEDVEKPDFFPRSETDETSLVRHGNLVAIDEAWRFWGSNKWPQEHMIFFREHRHYVDARGISCDMALMVQDITDLDKRLKNVIEMSFGFTKLKSLGFSSRYRIEVYEGSKLYKSKRTSWSSKTYNKKIFPLYKSYASDSVQGIEKSIDGRQNLLKSGAFFIPVVVAVVLISLGWWKLSNFFNPDRVNPKSQNAVSPGALSSSPKTALATPAGLPPSRQPPAETFLPATAAASISGSIVIGGDTWLVLNTPEGMRIASPSIAYSHGVSAITNDERKAVPAYLNND